MDEQDILTDLQFKHQLRKQLTDLNNKLELLNNKEYAKLEIKLLQEIKIIEETLHA